MSRLALVLVIIGALNWLLVGLFQFDLVAAIFGGQNALLSRVVYTLVGIAGIWCIGLLFRDRDRVTTGDRNRV
jgi:uncharacterized membrane protein YuzA (DUF378 family)